MVPVSGMGSGLASVPALAQVTGYQVCRLQRVAQPRFPLHRSLRSSEYSGGQVSE